MNAIDIFLLAGIAVCLGLAWHYRKSGRCCGDCEKCQKKDKCPKPENPHDSGNTSGSEK